MINLPTSRLERYGWPRGGRRLLLIAAGHVNHGAAAEAWANWIASHNIADCGYAESRLLARISARPDSKDFLGSHTEWLRGMERHVWAKSQQSLVASLQGVKLLDAAGIPVLAMKAMAQILRHPSAQRIRAVNDVDIAVTPDNLLRGFDTLVEAGWVPAESGSLARLRCRFLGIHGLNFFKGTYGDLDLHNWLVKPPYQNRAADTLVFAASKPVTYKGVPLLLPTPEAEAAVTIANSGMDASDTSDWILDLADLAHNNPIDPQALTHLAAQYRVVESALSILSFVREELGIDQLEPIVSHMRLHSTGTRVGMFRAGLMLRPANECTMPERGMRSFLRRHIRRQRRTVMKTEISATGCRESGVNHRPSATSR